MSNDKFVNSLPGINDIPQRELEFDELVNIAIVSEDAVKNGKIFNKDTNYINVSDLQSRTHYILTAVSLLPKTDKNWLIKRLLLWQVGGDAIHISPDHIITVDNTYIGMGYTVLQIAKKLQRMGLARAVDGLIIDKTLPFISRVQALLDDSLKVVCENLEKQSFHDIVPVS